MKQTGRESKGNSKLIAIAMAPQRLGARKEAFRANALGAAKILRPATVESRRRPAQKARATRSVQSLGTNATEARRGQSPKER